MPQIVQTPSFTECAELMPAGRDRDEIFARFGEVFDRRGGNSRTRSLRVLEKTRDAHERWLDEREQNPEAKSPVGAREGLRATMAIDKAFEKLQSLRNECFRQAFEEFYREHGYRACVAAWRGESDHPDMMANDFARSFMRDGKEAMAKEKAEAKAEQETKATEAETITLGTTTNKKKASPESDEAGITGTGDEAAPKLTIQPVGQAMTVA